MGTTYYAALVQWSLEPNEYACGSAYRTAVLRRVEAAMRNSRVVVVVFPELSGLPLQLSGIGYRTSPRNARLPHPLLFFLMHPGITAAAAAGRGAAVLASHWREHHDAWLSPFREAAGMYGIHICPGSTFLPSLNAGDPEISVFNTSCLIDPGGDILGYRRKMHLISMEKRLGVMPGSPEFDMIPLDSELGKTGITICLDGFHKECVEALDEKGTEYVFQPSANSLDWNVKLKRGRRVLQSEQWLSCGIGRNIQGCRNILGAYNPMDVTVTPLVSNSGCSSAWFNTHIVRDVSGVNDGYPGLSALAGNPYAEQILYAPVPGI